MKSAGMKDVITARQRLESFAARRTWYWVSDILLMCAIWGLFFYCMMIVTN